MTQPKATKSTTDDTTEPATYWESLKIALYSPYGGRKTLQIGHLIEMVGAANVLVVNAEHGLGTIRTRLTQPGNVLTVTNLAEYRTAWKAVAAFAAAHAGDPSAWVCIDGASSIHEWIANDQISSAERYFDLTAQGLPVDTPLKPFGRFIANGAINMMHIYGRIGRDSQNLLNALIGLPVNVYANYLEDLTGSDGFKSLPPYGPDVPGKVGLKAVMSSFDCVMRLSYAADGKLVAGCDPAQARTYMSRTRDDWSVLRLPTTIPDFRLDQFIRMVRGEVAAAAAE